MPDSAPHSVATGSPTCSFVLDNGRPCQGPACHGHSFCRHHTPEARARRHARFARQDAAPTALSSDPLPSDPDEISPWALRGYWRMHHRIIAHSENPDELEDIFQMVLGALATREISPCSAGLLLRAVLDRKSELQRAAQEAAIRAMQQQILRRAPCATAQVPVERR